MPTHDDNLDTIRDMRDMCQHWYQHAKRNRAGPEAVWCYLDAWEVFADLVLVLRYK